MLASIPGRLRELFSAESKIIRSRHFNFNGSAETVWQQHFRRQYRRIHRSFSSSCYSIICFMQQVFKLRQTLSYKKAWQAVLEKGV